MATYPDKDKVVLCLQDILSAVQSVAEFEQRTALVFDEDDAMTALKGLSKWPAAVVVYEGMRAVPVDGASGKTGASVVLVATIMVINQGETLVRTDTKIPTLLLLTQLRRHLLNRQSPSGHKWAFLVEAPAEAKKGMSFWAQRWQTPLQLQIN